MEPVVPQEREDAGAAAEVEKLFPGLPVSHVQAGVQERDLRALEEKWQATIPEEVRALLRKSRSFRVGTWVFHGADAWRITGEGDQNFWAVAESADQSRALCLVEEDEPVKLVMYDLLENHMHMERRGFVEALRSEAARGETEENG
jgi:hypothetical protein